MKTELATSLISATIALTIGVMTWLHNRATLREQLISERRKSIAKMLNEFYGPIISYLNVTKALFRLFAAGKPKGFRTLTHLLNPDQEYEVPNGRVRVELSRNDMQLLEELIDVEKKIESLVVEKGGLVDDERLMFEYLPDVRYTDVELEKGELSLLALLITHFRVLSLAYSGRIKGEVARYKDFVYPREIDAVLRGNREQLHRELDQLGRWRRRKNVGR